MKEFNNVLFFIKYILYIQIYSKYIQMFKIDMFKSSKAAKALSSFSYFPDYTSPDQVFFYTHDVQLCHPNYPLLDALQFSNVSLKMYCSECKLIQQITVDLLHLFMWKLNLVNINCIK